MAVVTNLDSKKVRLRWNIETHVVTMACDNINLASKYLSTLIISKRITAIKAIVFYEVYPGPFVKLYAGKHVEEFHALAHERRYKPRSRFTDLISNN